MSQRVFVIALDGATFDLIGPWSEAGHLPNLRKLMTEGSYGPLASTYPPLTGPAWGSFMTGKSPGQHSVFEFFRRKAGSYRQTLNSRLNLDGKSLWHLLSEGGKQVGVMGIPLSYPPESVNGFLITGLLTPPNARDFTHPADLLNQIEDHLGEPYRLRHDEKYRKSDPHPFIQEQRENLENNACVAEYLMTAEPWDFFMVHFLGTDRMQHEFWHLLDETHPQHDPQERQRLGNVVLQFFQEVDAKVGRLLQHLNEDDTVVVMSDHGFGPIHKFINFNTWLLEQKLIRLKSNPGTWFRYLLFRLGYNYSTLGHWILKLGFGRKAKQMGRGKRESLQRLLFLSLDDVDWLRTTVYSIGNYGQLYVNLKGREPEGIVAPGVEYEAVLNDLTQRLQQLVDPQTGELVICDIFRQDDIYEGPHTHQAPDLMFFTKEMVYKPMGLSDFSSPHVFEPVYGTTGHHRTDGIMIWHGANVVQSGAWQGEAHIQDLTPTILYLLGQPIPPKMDGKVLLDLFTPAFRQQHHVTFAAEADSTEDGHDSAYSEKDEAEVKEMLRALGYVN
ncbi:MAG: hypothetical protein GY796_29915 [Chloroflexi bacterium]|nr:hypothetical protein [Chloroflexota bacterium]